MWPRGTAVRVHASSGTHVTSLTPVGTSIGFVPEVEGGKPNLETAVLVDDSEEVAALLVAATGRR